MITLGINHSNPYVDDIYGSLSGAILSRLENCTDREL